MIPAARNSESTRPAESKHTKPFRLDEPHFVQMKTSSWIVGKPEVILNFFVRLVAQRGDSKNATLALTLLYGHSRPSSGNYECSVLVKERGTNAPSTLMSFVEQNLTLAAHQVQPVVADSFQTSSSIQVSTIESVTALIVFVFGIGAAWASLKSSVGNLEKTLNDDMKPTLSDLRDRFAVVEDRVDSLWKDRLAPAQSLRALNGRGLEILDKSGIKDVIDEHWAELEDMLRAKRPQNAYDAEREALACVMALPKRVPELLDRIKPGAFRIGADIDGVLFVGGVYFRDAILPALGFVEDQHVPPVGGHIPTA
jgi:hypothetical protein